MLENIDPVDRVLQSLGERAWPMNNRNPQLENMLMREFDSNTPVSFVARHRVLIPVVAVLILATAAFAAAGGVEMIKSLFITTSINGQVVDQRAVTLDENGSATFTVPLPTPSNGETAEVSMQFAGDGDVPDGTKALTVVSIEAGEGADGAQVTIQTEPQAKPADAGEATVTVKQDQSEENK